MQSLSECMAKLIDSLDGDAAKLARIAMNNRRYKDAVRAIWKDDEARAMILGHTNAFYVRVDEAPRKGMAEGERFVVGEICSDDALVRSELDTHRELLAFALRSNGLDFDELRIIPSRRGMRERHPFSDDHAETKGGAL